MAKFDEVLVMASLCFAVGVVLLFSPIVLAAEGDDVETEEPALSPQPSSDYSENLMEPELPPVASPGFFKFLERCSKKMNPECSKEIFAGLFNEEIALTKPCCARLVDVGKECHHAMVKILLTFPEFKSDNNPKVLIKSEQIWNKCSYLLSSAAVSPSPSPF